MQRIWSKFLLFKQNLFVTAGSITAPFIEMFIPKRSPNNFAAAKAMAMTPPVVRILS